MSRGIKKPGMRTGLFCHIMANSEEEEKLAKKICLLLLVLIINSSSDFINAIDNFQLPAFITEMSFHILDENLRKVYEKTLKN